MKMLVCVGAAVIDCRVVSSCAICRRNGLASPTAAVPSRRRILGSATQQPHAARGGSGGLVTLCASGGGPFDNVGLLKFRERLLNREYRHPGHG
jgi:hypothetical protein